MNNKGFTLIELLATVVILSLVMGIAGVGVTNAINNSRLKSEKIFVDKLAGFIDEYITLKQPNTNVNNTTYTFKKCEDTAGNVCYNKVAREVKESDGTDITLQDLLDAGIFDKTKIINPRNKLDCLNGKNPKVRIFKDDDYVYYYYVNLSGNTTTNCDITASNGLIDTVPNDLKSKVGLS